MRARAVPGPGDALAEEGAELVRGKTDLVPRVAIVLGSGLGPALGDRLEEDAAFAFTVLPGFPPPGVPGHEGRLSLGRAGGVPVAVYFGRIHFYEGGMDAPALLPRLAHALGADTIVLTAAVGGLRPGTSAGTLVVLTDHVNHMGTSPLRGWRFPDGSPAFVSLGEPYDRALADLALERAAALGLPAEPGVYAAMAGPAYETPAEIEHLRQAGATVVGMSVVPETVPAVALGMRVLGLCFVTNAFGEKAAHEEVVRISTESSSTVGSLLVDLLPRIDDREGA